MGTVVIVFIRNAGLDWLVTNRFVPVLRTVDPGGKCYVELAGREVVRRYRLHRVEFDVNLLCTTTPELVL